GRASALHARPRTRRQPWVLVGEDGRERASCSCLFLLIVLSSNGVKLRSECSAASYLRTALSGLPPSQSRIYRGLARTPLGSRGSIGYQTEVDEAWLADELFVITRMALAHGLLRTRLR